MARSRVEPLVGDPARIAALATAEARLGVTFPDDYRRFVADRRSYQIGVKRVQLHAVEKCVWTDDDAAVIIGFVVIDGVTPLVFKRTRSGLSEVTYERRDGVYKRSPRFAELVQREPAKVELSSDDRTRLAERLAGGSRRCRCGQEIRVNQICACGQLGKPTDPVYQLDADQQAHARAAHPDVWRAWELVRSLVEAGHVVPTGPKQLLATADALAQPDLARAILAAWKSTGMPITLDEQTITTALTA